MSIESRAFTNMGADSIVVWCLSCDSRRETVYYAGFGHTEENLADAARVGEHHESIFPSHRIVFEMKFEK